jgi:hypothetical protein
MMQEEEVGEAAATLSGSSTVRARHLTAKSSGLIAVFSALHVILYFISFGLWRNWAVYLEPIEGIVLGPWAGFSAALIGSVVVRTIKPVDVWMFGIVAEPLGVLACGLLAKGRWKPVIGIYGVMLVAYSVHPFGRWLPLWTILDILIALFLIIPAAKISENIFGEDVKRLSLSLVLTSLIGTVTDSLTRVFLLIPVGLYTFFGWSSGVVYSVFVMGAIDSYIEDILVIIVSLLVGVPLLIALRKISGFKFPLT